MIRRPAECPDFDLYEDLLAIARLDASITRPDRRKAVPVRDFARLAGYLPALRA